MTQYIIIDKTRGNELASMLDWKESPIAGDIVRHRRLIEVGDMFWIRDRLIELDYILWKDFAIKKVGG